MNAKLDRPLDSHAPQSEDTYYYSDDVWGDVPEQESEEQWDYEEYDPEEQTYESYPFEEEQYEYQADENQDQNQEQDQYQEECVDEDDQGSYE